MKNATRILLFLIINLYTFSMVWADDFHLLPKPQKLTAYKEHFALGNVTVVSPVLQQELNAFVTERGGMLKENARASIEIKIVSSLKGVLVNQDEAYSLKVTANKIKIEAITEQGVYWAMQTLNQLQENRGAKVFFRGCEILDWPAFRVRGFMHDVGRSYISMNELKREIAILSTYKINVFHWHLTENQSWRLESRIFPMLNDSINTTRMPGRFYTLEEAKELVAYCKEHHITLIPEFDMPGHSEAFIRTFRHDMQSPEGMKILKLLMDEVCEAFDVPYVHLGTDEVKFVNPNFVPEMVAHVRAKGKKVISWNPGWSYKPGEIDMMQLWSSRGRAHKGIPAIDSKFHYINHFDTFGDIIALYNSRICNVEQGSEDVAGTIVAVWNDRLLSNEQNIVLENNFYPNVLAMAERAWKGGGTEYFDKNGTMLRSEESPEFKVFADFENRLLWHKKHVFKGYPFAYVKQTNIRWKITDAFPNEGDLTKVFPPEQGIEDSYLYEGKEYGSQIAIGAGIYLRHVWGTLVPTFYKDPKENHTAYAYTYVYSPKKQEVGLWAEFQNYGRSEMDLAPEQGTWDYKGSRIWLNETEIMPPKWTSTHRQKTNEIALGNENCVARPPIPVHLNKGWNKIFLKLPVGAFKSPQVRLVKWMFTTVLVTLDGESAVEGLVYSPDRKR